MSELAALTAAIDRGDRDTATGLVRAAIDEGRDPNEILGAMTAAMDLVGRKFQDGIYFVPEMLISARAMKAGTELLEPVLVAAGMRPAHTAVIGTVRGDLHDIGKNLVRMMWKGANVAVVDLGTDVPPERFVAAAREHGASVVGVSALLTTTMPAMRAVVEAVHGELPGTKVLVGGAPLDADYAAEIGADGYARDAGAAVDVIRAALA